MSEQAKPKMSALAGLARIKPNTSPADPAAVAAPLPPAAREVAKAHGFVDRDPPPAAPGAPEPVPQRNRAKPPADTMRLFTMRVATRDANAFIEYCEQNRLSYREAFRLMIDRLPRD